jgi:hypothetical protein
MTAVLRPADYRTNPCNTSCDNTNYRCSRRFHQTDNGVEKQVPCHSLRVLRRLEKVSDVMSSSITTVVSICRPAPSNPIP